MTVYDKLKDEYDRFIEWMNKYYPRQLSEYYKYIREQEENNADNS
jgi:hypothetical protein